MKRNSIMASFLKKNIVEYQNITLKRIASMSNPKFLILLQNLLKSISWLFLAFVWGLFSNGLVFKMLDSQFMGPVFKTTGWLQGQLSLSSFWGW